MQKLILYLLLLGSTIAGKGQTQLASFFSNDMVLQQNENVTVWGKDKPDISIQVFGSWGSEAVTKTDAKGQWRTKISTPQAGGPYLLTIRGSQELILKNVLIGEVWLCSGQSNMTMRMIGGNNQPINNSNEEILQSKNDNIRMFKAALRGSLEPLDDVEGNWWIANPSTTGEFSAVAYFFGKKLYEILGVPIGLIHTSWGGSNAEAWIDKETLQQEFKTIELPAKIPDQAIQQTPTLLYNAMLHPFVGYTIKGMIWYQGEANISRPEEYKKLFPVMIRSWRSHWQQGDFPFYFVQIAPYEYPEINAAYLREAQLQTMQSVANTGMVVTTDVGECNNIHPREKKTVGNRLAYWALAKTYGLEKIAHCGPIYSGMEKTTDSKIKIAFDYCPMGLSGFGKELLGFEIADESKEFYPAKASINRDKTVSAWNTNIKQPVAVRYLFKNCEEGNLYNTEGLPASPFRTDDWKN